MNLSPEQQHEIVNPLGGRVFESGVAVMERDTAIEALIELGLGAPRGVGQKQGVLLLTPSTGTRGSRYDRHR